MEVANKRCCLKKIMKQQVTLVYHVDRYVGHNYFSSISLARGNVNTLRYTSPETRPNLVLSSVANQK